VDAALTALGNPPLFFTAELMGAAFDDKEELMNTLKSPQRVKRVLAPLGYELIRNPAGGKWQSTVDGRKAQSRLMAYDRSRLPGKSELSAVVQLAEERLRLWAAGKLKKFGTEDSAGPQDEGF